MKKIKKNDLKKLALLGLAGGTALSTQVNGAETSEINPSQLLASGACGGQTGCNHNGGGSYQAYRGSSGNYYYTQAPQGSCSSMPQSQYYQPEPLQYQQLPPNYQMPSNCASMSQPQYYNPGQSAPSSCASMVQPQYHPSPNNMPNMGQPSSSQTPSPQMSYGCGAMRPQMTRQMMAGCNAPKPNQGQMPNQPETPAPVDVPDDGVKKGQSYTQWETADNYRPAMQNSKGSAYQSDSTYDPSSDKQNSSKQTPKQKLNESDLISQLNAQGKATYQSLDATGKALALKLANQECKGRNECKGLNSCKTSEHSCAGKGSCAGTSEAPFKDKNLAVKVAAMKMAEKRANIK